MQQTGPAGSRVAVQDVAKVVPYVGVLIGATTNSAILGAVAAKRYCQTRLLCEKYGCCCRPHSRGWCTSEPLGVRSPFGGSEADPCVDGAAFAFADIVAGKPTDPLILPLSFGRGDPTFISEIALTTSTQADGSGDCINQVVARAPLVWTFGPLRPYLDTLVDGGTRSGAGGEVVIDATGRPVAYTIAPKDLLPEVAGRFGITPDDAFYLNPARSGSPEDPMLSVNEVLNLNLRAR